MNIEAKVEEYAKLREQAKAIKKRMEMLSEDIKEYAGTHGVKDDSGSFYCDSDKFVYGKQARKSVNFIEDKAIAYLKGRGLVDAVKTKEYIDNEVVDRYVSEGVITFNDLQSIVTTKTSYAIDVKVKEVMPEVEEVTLGAVASVKPKLLPFQKKRR